MTKKSDKNYWMLLVAMMAYPDALHAYVGPALAGSTIAVILGLIVSVLFAVFTIIWYPIKQLRKKKNAKKSDTTTAEDK